MIDRGDAFIASLDLRVSEILDRCTRCARCVEVCPTAGPAGIDTREPAAVVGDVLDILRGGADAASRGARWAQSCTGSGRCLSACDDGVNPRFMLAAARLKLNQQRAVKERHDTGQVGFQKMSEAVKVLSRVQLPAELLARITRSARADSEAAPDVVMYLGCNVLKTPHIALLCLEVLNRIGARTKSSAVRQTAAVSFNIAPAMPRHPDGSAATRWLDSPAPVLPACSHGAPLAISS